MLLSGGVDSTVCAALLKKALNADQIIAIHIDNGFMRKRESEAVRDSLAKVGLGVKGRLIQILLKIFLINSAKR